MTPTKKQPLFIITGASCAGKSTTCEILFQKEQDYLVMESDLLWEERYNTPDDNYCDFRRLWMRICANIAQIGKPAVLCGCAVPEQFECQPERELFSEIFYLAVVCDEEQLLKRAKEGRKVTEEEWLKSSVDFNNWLIKNGKNAVPPIELLNTTDLTPEEAADAMEQWIQERIGKGEKDAVMERNSVKAGK